MKGKALSERNVLNESLAHWNVGSQGNFVQKSGEL
jgi:hypothetical protein